MENSIGQFCVNVSDIDRAVEFWEGVIGIPVQSRTDIPNVKEVVLQAEVGGSRGQPWSRQKRSRVFVLDSGGR